ncbi:MAG: Ada metal-binding domain-containing protein [Geothrix sp.]|uniref:Ada metal-binding domain-containing protein n=1 Tax=Geothrix sp. TaxID=1962974 RepID=UPI003BB1056A
MNRALLALLFAAASVAALAQTKPAPAPAAKPAAPAAKPAAPAPAAKPAGAILANKDSKTYHRADCKAAAKIKEANRTSFGSAAEADKAGYKACKVCKP